MLTDFMWDLKEFWLTAFNNCKNVSQWRILTVHVWPVYPTRNVYIYMQMTYEINVITFLSAEISVTSDDAVIYSKFR